MDIEQIKEKLVDYLEAGEWTNLKDAFNKFGFVYQTNVGDRAIFKNKFVDLWLVYHSKPGSKVIRFFDKQPELNQILSEQITGD